jgi:hypothetical protein
MLHKDYDREGSVAKNKKKTLVVSLKGLEANTNWSAVNRPSYCNSDFDWELQKLVAEARHSSGTHRKGNVRRWKPLLSSAVETVTKNTSLRVLVICKV